MGNNLAIQTTLSELGLSTEAVLIISYLTEHLDVSVSEIGKKTGISRSSIYRCLDRLETQGWIQYVLTTQGKNIRLADLSSLKWIFAEQKQKLKERESNFNELIVKAENTSKTNATPLEIRYYEGRGGLRQTYWNMQKSSGLIRVFTSLVRRKLVGDKWLEYHLIEFARLKIPVRIIGDAEYAKYAYEEYGNREKYYGPAAELAFQFDERIYHKPDFKLKGEIIIYDDIVATHATEGGKIVGSEVKSNHLSTSFKSVFDEIWQLTSEKDRIDNLLN
ncbi:MAG: MarR family transcriptional regulator [bacterium]